jgi:hypothetical protein
MDSQQMVEAAGSAYSMKLENIDSSWNVSVETGTTMNIV